MGNIVVERIKKTLQQWKKEYDSQPEITIQQHKISLEPDPTPFTLEGYLLKKCSKTQFLVSRGGSMQLTVSPDFISVLTNIPLRGHLLNLGGGPALLYLPEEMKEEEQT